MRWRSRVADRRLTTSRTDGSAAKLLTRDEAGRSAHLNGKVAAALMEKAKTGDLFAKAPEIHRIDILADKLPH
jgi:hypothetical protein